jgi:hypothetical protein
MKSCVRITTLLLLTSIVPLAARAQAVDSAQASSLLRSSKFAEAREAYRGLTSRQPANPSHWAGLGQAEHSLGNYAGSEAAFAKALELYPATPPRFKRIAWYNVASARARLGKVDDALVALDSATNIPFFSIQMLDADQDLATIRSDARYEAIKRKMLLAVSPCDTMPKAREFDFWIGEWNVHAPGGGLAGTSLIQKVSNGCALLENWTGGMGQGKSLNFYNATAGYWQQTWIGSAGGPVEYRDGAMQGNTMVFLAKPSNGQGPLQRLSFTNLGPNRVRQHAETSTDNGATWTTTYDFQYLRKGSSETP